MADNRKLAQGLMMMTPAMRADLAGREQDIQRGKTVELLRRAGKEMYDNPIVNTAIGFSPVLGDIQAAGETMSALERGAPWQETAGYAVGMLPFIPMVGKTVWHGSPHTFDKFDLSKIGTGEGAQALRNYGLEHRPMTIEGGASQLHELTPSFGEDVYGKQAMQYFGSGDPREKKALEIMKSVRGNPDAPVTIYRGVPEGVNQINQGDWVTIVPEVAADYGNVISQQVPASHITSWPDSLMEFGYYPPKAK